MILKCDNCGDFFYTTIWENYCYKCYFEKIYKTKNE